MTSFCSAAARMVQFIALLVLALVSSVLPVLRLPAPTGPFRVGTTMVPLDGALGLTLQIWYPAELSSGWRPALYEPVRAGKRNKVFRWLRTAAGLDAPLARQKTPFPVLVYVNSWNGTRGENTALMQEFASHGFVVASSDQPAGVLDGVNLSADMDFSGEECYAATLRLIAVKLRLQVRLASQAMDRLAELNADPISRFSGRLDTARAGIVGFSFGGATAAEAALADRRFRASLNMDGLTFGEAARIGPPFPYLEMSDDSPPVTDADRLSSDRGARILARVLDDNERHTRINFARNGGYYLAIRGSRHPNFSDYPILVPWRRMNGSGPVNPARAGELVRYWALSFFQAALGGGTMPSTTVGPEVTLESWPATERDPDRRGEAVHANPVDAPR